MDGHRGVFVYRFWFCIGGKVFYDITSRARVESHRHGYLYISPVFNLQIYDPSIGISYLKKSSPGILGKPSLAAAANSASLILVAFSKASFKANIK